MKKWKRILRGVVLTILILLALAGVPIALPGDREKFLHKRTQKEWVDEDD